MNITIIKGIVIGTIMSISCLSASAQWGESAKQTFESPKLKSEISKHKLVAILPYSVKISYKKAT